ncbi:hypothetical protein F4778DRAFT_787274 [Xylariomycetidae sp. FL2044]|nr:hypothetical protein F4778DRAFT_787274 [Xylariomycetidae sp. FL2044]
MFPHPPPFPLLLLVLVLLLLLSFPTPSLTEISPDGTCGINNTSTSSSSSISTSTSNNQEEEEYTCPGPGATTTGPCCSKAGYCEPAGSASCLTSQGCQAAYSNATSYCVDPVNATTPSPDAGIAVTRRRIVIWRMGARLRTGSARLKQQFWSRAKHERK